MSAPPLTSNTTSSQQTRPVPWRPSFTALLSGFLATLSVLNLLGVIGLIVLLCVVSERWWFSLVLTYLPRVPYLLPSLMLAVTAILLRRRRWIWLNLFALALVAGPVMGLRLPWGAWTSRADANALTVVSCNLQGGKADLQKVVDEFKQIDPDLLILQEASYGYEVLKPYLVGWSQVHVGEFLVASRFPVALKDICRCAAFNRATAILCEVDGPQGAFLVCNVHLTTARHGLTLLRPHSLFTRMGIDELQARQDLRASESSETRVFASHRDSSLPLLVAGDFNTPTSSSLFQRFWSDLTSAFDAGGFGYGYTSPCSHHRRWPDNTPWLRIDHILSSNHWDVGQSWIGRSDGSDHRLVAARVSLRPAE